MSSPDQPDVALDKPDVPTMSESGPEPRASAKYKCDPYKDHAWAYVTDPASKPTHYKRCQLCGAIDAADVGAPPTPEVTEQYFGDPPLPDLELDKIFNKPAGDEAFYLRSEIEPKLTRLIYRRLKAELETILADGTWDTDIVAVRYVISERIAALNKLVEQEERHA